MADKDVIKSWWGILRSYSSFFDCKFHTNKGNGFWVSSPQTSILKNNDIVTTSSILGESPIEIILTWKNVNVPK